MAKEGGRVVFGMPPFVGFDICAAGQGRIDFYQQVFRPHLRHRHLLKGELAGSHKNSRPHAGILSSTILNDNQYLWQKSWQSYARVVIGK